METQIYRLLDYVQTLSTITCEKCRKEKFIEADNYDSADDFYRKGWRVIRGKCICHECQNKKK